MKLLKKQANGNSLLWSQGAGFPGTGPEPWITIEAMDETQLMFPPFQPPHPSFSLHDKP